MQCEPGRCVVFRDRRELAGGAVLRIGEGRGRPVQRMARGAVRRHVRRIGRTHAMLSRRMPHLHR